jgi:hypothetical protein
MEAANTSTLAWLGKIDRETRRETKSRLRGFFDFRRFFFHGGEVPIFATVDEAFGHTFQFLPTGANGLRLLLRDFVIGRGNGDNAQQVRKFLHDHVRGRHEEIRMSPVMFWVLNEETTCAFANPLHKAQIVGAPDQRFDAVQGVGRAAAAGFVGLSPLIDERLRKAHIGGDLLDVAFFEDFTKKFVGLHAGPLAERAAGAIDFPARCSKTPNSPSGRKHDAKNIPGKLDAVRRFPVNFFFGRVAGR